MQVNHEDSFTANVQAHGASVHIHATTLDALLKTLAQFGHGSALAADVKPAKKEAAVQTGKSAPTVTATSSPAETPAPATATQAEQPAGPTYDDIKRSVLAMAKVSQALAVGTLAKFTGVSGAPCDHGNKLKLEDYPAFLAAAAEALKG